MNHRIFGRKLSRTTNERRRLLQNLAREVILHGRIETTLAKAKAVQPLIDKLVTQAKNGNSSGLIRIRQVLADKYSVDRLLNDAKTRFSGRSGGYTRIYKTGVRPSDSARMAILEFVDSSIKTEIKSSKVAAKITDTKKPLIKTVKKTPVSKVKARQTKTSKK